MRLRTERHCPHIEVRNRPSSPTVEPRRAFGNVIRACIGALLLAATAGPLLAQTKNAKTPNIGDLQRRLESERKNLQADQARRKKLESGRAAAMAERRDLTGRSMMLARKQQETERRLTAIEAEIAALNRELESLKREEEKIQTSLDAQRHKIARLLAAMQRMGRNPPPVIITRRTDALSMVRSAMLLARAFPELREEALKLSATLEKRRKIRLERENKRAERVARREQERNEKIKLDREHRELDNLIAKKRQLIAKYDSDLDQVALEAKKKAGNIKTLSELITSLDKTVAEKTNLGAYNRAIENAKDPDLAQPARPNEPKVALRTPPANPSVIPPESGITTRSGEPPSLPKAPEASPGVTLIPSTSTLPLGAGRLSPAIPFAKAVGRLPLPTAGKRVLRFGEQTRYSRKSQGVVFETRPNARITAPADGWVVYAGTFRSYGQLLIINTGGGYHIVMAGMARIDVQLGQFILASEPVGTMGGLAAQDGNAAPVLYVEFRKNGRPIDPSRWWAKNQVVAQR